MDYLFQWQSQILNNAKFSEELGLNTISIDTENIKQDIDDIKLCEIDDNLELEEDDVVVTNGDERVDGRRAKINNSVVYEHFYKVKIFHPITKKPVNGAICKYCKTRFSTAASGNLKRHLGSYHPEVLKEVQSK